jgi:hypothetical protein
VLAIDRGRRGPDVAHPYTAGLAVTYIAAGAPDQPLGWNELAAMRIDDRALRRHARDNLNAEIASVRLHGGQPAFMVSFHGIESSLLLADAFWDDLPVDLPGDPVVAVPARDVLIITGSESPGGLAKAARCVERVFFAGSHHPLVPDLLVRRRDHWQRYDPAEPVATLPEPVEEWQVERRHEAVGWSTPEDRTIAPRRAG